MTPLRAGIELLIAKPRGEAIEVTDEDGKRMSIRFIAGTGVELSTLADNQAVAAGIDGYYILITYLP